MPKDKRMVTSAIHDMSVTEVRRDLDCLRKYWAFCDTNDTDVDPAYRLSTGKHDIQTFCLKFMMGHHMKRHQKSQRSWCAGDTPPEPTFRACAENGRVSADTHSGN